MENKLFRFNLPQITICKLFSRRARRTYLEIFKRWCNCLEFLNAVTNKYQITFYNGKERNFTVSESYFSFEHVIRTNSAKVNTVTMSTRPQLEIRKSIVTSNEWNSTQFFVIWVTLYSKAPLKGIITAPLSLLSTHSLIFASLKYKIRGFMSNVEVKLL